MRRAWVSRARPLMAPLTVALAHWGLLHALHAVGIMGRVLGAARPSAWAVGALIVFYGLRLMALFVVPGWLLWACGRVVMEGRAERAAHPGSETN